MINVRIRRSSSVVGVLAWLGTVGSACWLAFAYLLPEDLSRDGPIYSRLAVVAFFGRVFTFQVGLALAAAAMVGIALRRWRLLAISTLLAACCLAPTLAACLPRRPTPITGPTRRVMSINLEYSNTHYEAVLGRIADADPDVAVMEEYTPLLDQHLRPALADRYPYQCVQPEPFGRGLAVFSRRPFVGAPEPRLAGRRSQIRVVLLIGDRPVALYAVHPQAPLYRGAIMENRFQVADLTKQFAAERLPIVAAGDWNFTSETANAGALASAGLTDAFDQAGLARGSTWPVRPRWKSWLPGVRIDHVYLTPQLTCARYATGGFDGSDHLPIVADVGFLVPRSAAKPIAS